MRRLRQSVLLRTEIYRLPGRGCPVDTSAVGRSADRAGRRDRGNPYPLRTAICLLPENGLLCFARNDTGKLYRLRMEISTRCALGMTNLSDLLRRARMYPCPTKKRKSDCVGMSGYDRPSCGKMPSSAASLRRPDAKRPSGGCSAPTTGFVTLSCCLFRLALHCFPRRYAPCPRRKRRVSG